MKHSCYFINIVIVIWSNYNITFVGSCRDIINKFQINRAIR